MFMLIVGEIDRFEPQIAHKAAYMTYIWVQWLRGAAACMVIAFHALGHVQPAIPASISAFLDSGVDLFFVISGFVIWITTDDDRRSVADFVRSRIVRIVPLYWFATFLVVILAAARGKQNFGAVEVVKTLFFVPYFSGDGIEVFPITGVGWTLNLEVFFYFLFAILLLAPKRIRATVFLVGFPGLAVAGMFIAKTDPFTAAYTNPIIAEFSLGIAAGLVARRNPPRLVGQLAIAVAAVGLAGALLAWEPGTSRVLYFGVPYFALLLGLVVLERFRPAPSVELPMLLGNASYSIYLFHGYAVQVVGKLIHAAASLPLQLLLAALGVAFSAAVGVIAHWFVERPLLDLFRKFRRKSTVGAAA